MNDWQIVPKRRTIQGVEFRLHGEKGNKLTIYIGAGTRRKIKNYKPNGYCNVYKKTNNLMVQVVYVSDESSRKIVDSVFSLQYSVIKQYWKDGARKIEIPAIVEKDNLILLDLRDLGK